MKINQGGVYAVVGHVSDGINQISSARTLTVTQPNSMLMLWVMPQYILSVIADVVTSIKGNEFVYASAPPNMKSIAIAFWYLLYDLGSFFVILFTKAHMFNRKVNLTCLHNSTVSSILVSSFERDDVDKVETIVVYQ